MSILTFALLALYAIVMPMLFSSWYSLYLGDRHMTASQRQTSRIVMVIAAVLWPIVLPLSYLELLKKVKRYERQSLAQPNFAPASQVY